MSNKHWQCIQDDSRLWIRSCILFSERHARPSCKLLAGSLCHRLFVCFNARRLLSGAALQLLHATSVLCLCVCNCTVSQEDVKSVVTCSTTLLASASPLHSMAVFTSIVLICLLSSCVVLQLSKRFQQPQAGGPTAQYDRGAYMLDRLGLSVSVGCSCMSRQSACTAFPRNLLHTMRFAPCNRTAAAQVC